MNTYQYKDNLYKNGEWKLDRSEAMAKENRRSKVPTAKQQKYRDELYKFCLQKGVLKDGFPLARTKCGMQSNIRAFITILKKNGLEDEFFGRKER